MCNWWRCWRCGGLPLPNRCTDRCNTILYLARRAMSMPKPLREHMSMCEKKVNVNIEWWVSAWCQPKFHETVRALHSMQPLLINLSYWCHLKLWVCKRCAKKSMGTYGSWRSRRSELFLSNTSVAWASKINDCIKCLSPDQVRSNELVIEIIRRNKSMTNECQWMFLVIYAVSVYLQ